MIIAHYKAIGIGLLNYYSCADNFTRVKARVTYILKYSCALTFASKLKLKTLNKVFMKYGYDLAVSELVKGKNKVVAKFADKELTGIKSGFKLNQKNYDPLTMNNFPSRTFSRTRQIIRRQM